MIEQKFEKIYEQFRIEFYRNLFKKLKDKETQLTATEMFVAEVIYLLKRPTIKEFTAFIDISGPNATYKIKSLIDKGFVKKVSSGNDGREFLLEVTDKFHEYYSDNGTYGSFIFKKIQENLNEDDINDLDRIIDMLMKKVF